MKNKKKISAIVLAGTMMLSMGTSALAAVPTVDNNGKASITKDFVMAEGIATPAATFDFKAEAVTEDAPKATIQSISFAGTEEADPVGGIMTVSKESEIVFETFPHAGEYVYTVTETAETASVPGEITYSTDTYTLRVYVMNGENGDLVIKNMTAEKGTDEGIAPNKVNEIKFVNTYRKNAALTIKNNTTGELADKTKDFKFTITITPSETETTENPVYTGTIGETEVPVTAGTPAEFSLCNGETLSFDSLPAGTRYVVTEAGEEDGYTPSVEVVENGENKGTQTATNEADGISSAKDGATNLVGENDNNVTFTNAYMDVAITGIIMNNLPFVLVIGVAVLALGALAILKKQRFGRR